MSKITCFTDEKRPRVYVQNLPVCTGTTLTCVETCARGAGTHGDVLSGHTEFRSVSHTNTHINTHNTHNTTQHITTTTPHGERDRDRQRQRKKTGTRRGERTEEERKDKRREDKRRQDKTRQEKRPFFVGAVICLVNPVCARDFSLQNSVKYDSSLISFSAPWPVNSFLLSVNLFFYAVTVFIFFCFFFCLCSYSFKFFRIIYLCSYSFFFCRNKSCISILWKGTQKICIPSKNTGKDLTMKQMFISEKVITEQSDEIYGISKIFWEHSSWKYLSLVGAEEVISLFHTKVCVFSDSVLCFGKVNENPQSNTAWEERLAWFKSSPEYRALDKIDGEPMEFEWNIFPGFTTLQLCTKVQESLSRLSVTPEKFTGRIIFMSMFNDISWGSKDNKKNANQVLNSCLSMRRDLEQDNGHSSDLDQKRIGTLLVKTVHKENGTELQSK